MIYAYHENLAFDQKMLFQKCHRHRNALYKQVLDILRIKLKGIYTLTELLNKVLNSLTIRQLKMIIDKRLPVSLLIIMNIEAQLTLKYFSQHLLLLIV